MIGYPRNFWDSALPAVNPAIFSFGPTAAPAELSVALAVHSYSCRFHDCGLLSNPPKPKYCCLYCGLIRNAFSTKKVRSKVLVSLSSPLPSLVDCPLLCRMMGSLSNQDAAVSSSNDSDGNSSASAPTGGTDRTSLPDNIPPGWNVKITIHGATGLPPADINTLSCDPYVEASIRRHNLPQRHPEDSRPCLAFCAFAPADRSSTEPSYRTSAIPRSINPVWESSWLLGNCPGSGFQIKCRVMDEDPNVCVQLLYHTNSAVNLSSRPVQDSDDRLGNAYVDVKGPLQPTSSLHRQEYSILKRKGSWRAYGAKAVLQAFASSHHESRGRLCVSVEVLERTTARSGAKMFTIGPSEIRRFSTCRVES